MDNTMTDRLNAILNDPNAMQQIMSLAKSLNAAPSANNVDVPKQRIPESGIPMEILSGLVGQGNLDHNQTSLINALSPYLSRQKLNKLERAMRASKMAGIASSFLNSGGLQILTGR